MIKIFKSKNNNLNNLYKEINSISTNLKNIHKLLQMISPNLHQQSNFKKTNN